MKASLEKINTVRQKLAVEVPADHVGKAYSAAIENIRKEAKVSGFRKGKVPAQIIEKRFGDEISDEAAKIVVKETFALAVKETEAKPLSEPEFASAKRLENNAPYSYDAYFDVYPEFKATGYEGLKLEREKVEVDDKEVDAELNRLQHQMTQLEPSPEGELGPGMVAFIDFKGTADGKTFQGSEAENYVVDYGTGALLEEFEIRIKGMKGGEQRDISFKYPDSHFKKEIAGKEGKFSVKVKEVRRKIVPNLDDEFAKELGGNFSTLNDVRKDIKEKIAEYKELLMKNKLRDQAIHTLIEKHKDLEAPTVLIEAELSNMLQQLDNQLKARGKTLADAKIDSKEFVKTNLEDATNRAKGYLIVSAITQQEKIDITEAETNTKLDEIAKQNRQPVAKIKEHFEKNKLMGQLNSQLLFEKTLDFVLNKAKIVEVKPKNKK